jgi:hypothetical protein
VSEITRRGATKSDDVQKTRRVEWSWRLAGWQRVWVVAAGKSEVRLLLQVRGPMGAAEGEHGRAA